MLSLLMLLTVVSQAEVPVEAAPEAAVPEAAAPEAAAPEAAAPEAAAPPAADAAPVLVPQAVEAEAPAAPQRLAVYKVDLPVESTVTIGSLGLFVLIDVLIKPSLEGEQSCRRPVGNGRCDPADLSAIDRYSVGRQSPEWSTFGDVALVGALVAPLLYLGIESLALPSDHPFLDFLNDALVVAEAVSLTGAMNTVFKFAFRRPRPIRYSDLEVPIPTFDQELSIPSGHTALVTAATTALTTTFFLRHPRSPVKWGVLAGGVALSVLTGVSRIESGNHFATDVMVGALFGGFAAFIVPYFHRADFRLSPIVSFDPAGGRQSFGVSGRF